MELTDTLPIFAFGITVDKTALGSTSDSHNLGVHYTDPLLGLITLTVGTSPGSGFGSPQVTNYGDTGEKINYTISRGAVLVQLREGKVKDHITLVCRNLDSITVTITK